MKAKAIAMTKLPEHQNKELIEGLQKQSADAFAEAVRLFTPLVYRTCLRILGNPHEAQDATQVTFFHLHRCSRRLSARVILGGWLYHRARFTAMHQRRHLAIQAKREQEAAMESRAYAPGAQLWEQLSPDIDEAIGALPAVQRDAMILRYFQGLSQEETAAALGCNVNTAASHVLRGLNTLRSWFKRREREVSVTAMMAALELARNETVSAGVADSIVSAGAAGAAVSGPVAALSASVEKALFWMKVKLVSSVVAGAALLSAGTVTILSAKTGIEGRPPAPAASIGSVPDKIPSRLPTIETHYIGFRGNGAGVFPEDCTPVTSWSKDVNVAWKTQLPESAYYGNNSGPIVAGGKVFVLAEQTPDSLGPILFCLDPRDGNILWQADCNHIDSLPEGLREQTRKDLLAVNRFELPFKKWGRQFRDADLRLKRETDTLDAATTAEIEAERDAARAELVNMGIRNPAYPSIGPVLLINKGDTMYEERERLIQAGYAWSIDPWVDMEGRAVGRACCTPCSDGERVYVATAFQDLFCFDLNGALLWRQYWGDGQMTCDRANYFPSPILVDGMVIRYRRATREDPFSVRAFDALTGKLLYTVYGPKTDCDLFIGTPQILTVDGVRLLYLHDGRIIRAKDGEVLLEETVDYAAHGRSNIAVGDWLWTVNGQDGGHYEGQKRNMKDMELIAHRFSWIDPGKTQLDHRIVWRAGSQRKPWTFGYHNGRVYHRTEGTAAVIRDAFTGVQRIFRPAFNVRKVGNDLTPIKTHHVMAFVPGMVFSTDREHGWAYFSAADLTLIDLTLFAEMGCGEELNLWQDRHQPFFSGNRLFLRKAHRDPWIYCIGDPKEPTRLSDIHTKPLPQRGEAATEKGTADER